MTAAADIVTDDYKTKYGFADSPGLLLILGFVPVVGGILSVVVLIWTLVTSFIATRQALDIDNTKTVFTILIGAVALAEPAQPGPRDVPSWHTQRVILLAFSKSVAQPPRSVRAFTPDRGRELILPNFPR